MRHHGILSVCALAATCTITQLTVSAKPIGDNEAAMIAAKYVKVAATRPAYSAKSTNPDTRMPYFVFNDACGKGFVIVAGDDRINPVLGYSDSGSIDAANMPNGLKSWLTAVADYAGSLPERDDAAIMPAEASPVVEPLVKTQWYQLEPYNNMAPVSGCFTGCGATAMAQIMNYHKWPDKGMGKVSYNSFAKLYSGSTDIAGDLTTDLSTSTYDWGNMLATYTKTDGNANWNETQANAVALLMKDCGYAAYMQYSTLESSTYDIDAATALSEHFGYDTKVHPHFGQYDSDKWFQAMKQEFDNGFPVMITGQNSVLGGGGHAFVADGYDSNNFIHINWGWNGEADGYYNYCALIPSSHEANGNHSFMQYFTSIHPRKPLQAQPFNAVPVMLYSLSYKDLDHSGIYVADSGVEQSVNSAVNVTIDGFAFVSGRAYKGTFSLVALDADGNAKKTLATAAIDKDALSENNSDQSIDIKSIEIPSGAFAGMEPGTYTIVPMCSKWDESTGSYLEPQQVQVLGYKHHITATVNADKVTLTNIARPVTKLRYTRAVELPERYAMFRTVHTSATIENSGDFIAYGTLNVYLVNTSNNDRVAVKSLPLSLYERQTLDIPLNIDLLNSYSSGKKGLTEGEYRLALEFVNPNGDVIENNFEMPTINVFVDDEYIPYMRLNELKIFDGDSSSYLDIDNVELDLWNLSYAVEFKYEVIGEALPPSISLRGQLCDMVAIEQQNTNMMKSTTGFDILCMTKPMDTELRIEYMHPLTGEYVLAKPESLSRIKVKVIDPSGVEEIGTDEAIHELERFDARGVRLQSPEKGINFVRMSDGSVRKVAVVK